MMKHLGLLLTLLAAVMLAGCGGDLDDLHDYAKKVRARKSGNIKPIPKITPYAPYIYDATGMRDPFAPLALAPTKSKSKLHPDTDRPREPLEAFPLDGLRMVGTITVAGQIYALIRAPDGVVYRVTHGNHLGRSYGKIIGITQSEVKITELVPDGLGGWGKHAASLTLSQ